jgi:CPA1 family monovalent cation:H+ antiporter
VLESDRRALHALRGVPLFAELPERELKLVARAAREEAFLPGEDLVTEGKPAGPMFVLVEGKATVFVHGKERASLGAGDFFGEMALIDRQPRSATVRADSEVLALAISSWDFLALLQESWELTHRILTTLGTRIRVLDQSPTTNC